MKLLVTYYHTLSFIMGINQIECVLWFISAVCLYVALSQSINTIFVLKEEIKLLTIDNRGEYLVLYIVCSQIYLSDLLNLFLSYFSHISIPFRMISRFNSTLVYDDW